KLVQVLCVLYTWINVLSELLKDLREDAKILIKFNQDHVTLEINSSYQMSIKKEKVITLVS
ncbi:MAG: hypothetical protein QQN41_12620, partial [Nitrosopumilus sp.]